MNLPNTGLGGVLSGGQTGLSVLHGAGGLRNHRGRAKRVSRRDSIDSPVERVVTRDCIDSTAFERVVAKDCIDCILVARVRVGDCIGSTPVERVTTGASSTRPESNESLLVTCLSL